MYFPRIEFELPFSTNRQTSYKRQTDNVLSDLKERKHAIYGVHSEGTCSRKKELHFKASKERKKCNL